MNEFSRTVNDTQILIHQAKVNIDALQESNRRLIENAELMTMLCKKFLEDTHVKEL